jgi:serine/threonine protein phosphatase PrpC
MRKNSIEFKTGFTSEAGTYRTNKDFFAYTELDDMACYIAADGLDSDEEVKSAELAANSFFECFLENPTMSRRKIKNYIMHVHKTLIANSTSVRLKSSMIIMITDYSNMIWVVSGNARLYHFRKGGFSFRSKDQSVAQMMVDAGKISEEECNFHDERNNLTNFIGNAKGFTPFISKKFKLSDGDSVIMATSGFWENIDSLDLVEALKEGTEPNEIICGLEDLFLSRQSKVINNYTLSVILMNKVFKEGPRQDKRLKMAKKIAMVLIPIIVVASIGLIIRNVKKKNLEKDAITYEQDGDKNLKDKFYDKAEEAYASAVKAVKSINEKESLERVERKHSILKKILEGDEQYDKQDFENAKVSYTDAMGNLKFFSQYDNNVFSKEDLYITIDKKIKNTKNCLDVKDQFGKGNKLFDDGKFRESLPVYEAALKKAEDIYYDEMTDKLEKKIEEVKKKLEEDEATAAGQAKDKKLLEDFIKEVKDKWKEIENFVKQAKAYETKEYEKAIGRYEKAIEKCEEIVELPNSDDYKEVKDKKEVKELKELTEAKKKQIEYEDKIIDLNNKKDAEKAEKAG